jgi:hypothetical protein
MFCANCYLLELCKFVILFCASCRRLNINDSETLGKKDNEDTLCNLQLRYYAHFILQQFICSPIYNKRQKFLNSNNCFPWISLAPVTPHHSVHSSGISSDNTCILLLPSIFLSLNMCCQLPACSSISLIYMIALDIIHISFLHALSTSCSCFLNWVQADLKTVNHQA